MITGQQQTSECDNIKPRRDSNANQTFCLYNHNLFYYVVT